jgi:hypothetical protein
MERMSETTDGNIAYRLRHVRKGKPTHRVMRPIDFLARLAAIIPPPRHPPLRYFGVFAPHSSWRKLCVPQADVVRKVESTTPACQQVVGTTTPANQSRDEAGVVVSGEGEGKTSSSLQHEACPRLASGTALLSARIDWATLLKRTYDFDVLQCDCGGRLKAVELVTDAARRSELLRQFGMSTEPPPIARARSPDWD